MMARDFDEVQYLSLVQDVIANGALRNDRTGTGTVSVFAPPQLRFSLADNSFPLLTTKKTFLRPIFEELMWFIRGQTDGKVLIAHIIQDTLRQKCKDLGRKRFKGISVLDRTWSSSRERFGTCLWISMATFWGRI